MIYDLGVIGGGVAVQMARPALANYGNIAITYIDGSQRDFPEFDFVDGIDTLLDRQLVSAIYIATPVISHIDLASRVAQAGLPVLIEKPLGVDPADAKRFGAKGTSGVALAFRKRYSNIAVAIRTARGESPRSPSKFGIVWLAPHPGKHHWKAGVSNLGGGICLDLGSHILDFIEFCFDPIVDLRVADASLERRTGSDEYVQLSAILADGSEGSIKMGWASEEPLQLITCVHESTDLVWVKDPQSPESYLYSTTGQQSVSALCRRRDEYDRMLLDFRRFTLGSHSTIPDWSAGLRNLELISEVLDQLGRF